MARYIECEAIKKSIAECFGDLTEKDAEYIVERVPDADVVEVKHGEWVYWQPDGTDHLWSCSVCDGVISTPMKFDADHIKYCEHCGAKMDLKEGVDNE